jgi:hypothetical protein
MMRVTGKGAGPRETAAVFLLVLTPALLPSKALAQQTRSIAPAGQFVAPSGSLGLSSPGMSLAPPAGAPMGSMAGPSPGQGGQSTVSQTLAPGPAIPAGQVGLVLSARYGRDIPQPINAGLLWRVYAAKPDPSGIFRPLKEDKAAAPTFVLPPGDYVVHVSFGLASATRTVHLKSETTREVFELPAGGLRLEGRVGNVRIPSSQISFDVFRGSQFEPGEQRIAQGVSSGDVVVLPEGTYHLVSNYGDSNSVVRSDIRVQAGKLTDVTVTHRAAVITLKLVTERGGEALANTNWSVLTPGGDVVKESIGAFPKVILAEGDYRAIARNEGKTYEREFKVITGVDGEIEVLTK